MKKLIAEKITLVYIDEFIKHYDFKLTNINNINNNDIVYIITYSFNDIDLLLEKCSKVYIINLEQLSIKLNENQLYQDNEKRILKYFKNIDKYINNPKIEIIDYSYENKLLWKEIYNYNLNTIMEPYFEPVSIQQKNIDIICLFNNEYRNKIKNKYLSKLNIYNFRNHWEDKRRNIFKKTKILINLHAGENYKIGETFRINEALENKIIIISQHCYKNELLDKRIIFCDDNEIQEKCIDVLNNYDYYYNNIFK